MQLTPANFVAREVVQLKGLGTTGPALPFEGKHLTVVALPVRCFRMPGQIGLWETLTETMWFWWRKATTWQGLWELYQPPCPHASQAHGGNSWRALWCCPGLLEGAVLVEKNHLGYIVSTNQCVCIHKNIYTCIIVSEIASCPDRVTI